MKLFTELTRLVPNRSQFVLGSLESLIGCLYSELRICEPRFSIFESRLSPLEVEVPRRELLRELTVRRRERTQLSLKRFESRVRCIEFLMQVSLAIARNLQSCV